MHTTAPPSLKQKSYFGKKTRIKNKTYKKLFCCKNIRFIFALFFSHVAAVIGQQVSLPLLLLSLPSTLLIYLFGKLVLGKLDFVLAIIFDSMNK
jgi:hypothetical protein